MNWQGETVFLTGASSGIGEALAVDLAKKGAVLGLVARRKDLLEELAAKCIAAGGNAIALPCDVTDASALEQAAIEFRRKFGHIGIAIANAGIGGNNEETRNFQPQAVKKVIDINLLGAVNMIHAILPAMKERGKGHLVAISSLAGFRGLPKSAAYCASKAAMTSFFESLRLDVRHLGLDVTIVQPGFIKTPLTDGRAHKMPYLMELDDAIPYFVRAIEKKKRFAAFPWQLATLVRAARYFPGWMYDRFAGKRRYRE
ncbi:MAG: SDR family NAD(P)-dependent oxidoreductase [Acidobacteria bacterium]|nr:SDR family NAD(P)-dependent oxidoreductase [Acidobacteriota bacterium]